MTQPTRTISLLVTLLIVVSWGLQRDAQYSPHPVASSQAQHSNGTDR